MVLFQGGAAFPGNDWTRNPGGEEYLSRIPRQSHSALARIRAFHLSFTQQALRSGSTGVAALMATDRPLADYLRQTRSWSEELLERRNAIEHEGWMLPAVKYQQTSSGVGGIEPQISGRPAREFAGFMLDRLTCFVEEVTTNCLQQRLPADITITEIARADRVEDMPERFHVTVATGGLPRWQIAYHTSSFEQT